MSDTVHIFRFGDYTSVKPGERKKRSCFAVLPHFFLNATETVMKQCVVKYSWVWSPDQSCDCFSYLSAVFMLGSGHLSSDRTSCLRAAGWHWDREGSERPSRTCPHRGNPRRRFQLQPCAGSPTGETSSVFPSQVGRKFAPPRPGPEGLSGSEQAGVCGSLFPGCCSSGSNPGPTRFPEPSVSELVAFTSQRLPL